MSFAGDCFLQSGASSSHQSGESACAPETDETDMERGEDEDEPVGLFIPEPMLCCEAEDGKVPHSLEMLYQAARCNSASDCLLLAVHVLLLETGFLPQVRGHTQCNRQYVDNIKPTILNIQYYTSLLHVKQRKLDDWLSIYDMPMFFVKNQID